MASLNMPLFWGQKYCSEQIDDTSCEKLLTASGTVSPDGAETIFRVQYTNQEAFNVHVEFNEIGWIEHEVQAARKLMQARLRLKLDRGAQELVAISETALRPIETEVILDPMSGDQVIVHQFENQSPLGIRLSPGDVHGLLLRITDAANRARRP